MEAQTAPRLKDAKYAADRLNVRLHRVYELVRTGQLPHVRIGRQVRIDPETLEAWIEDGGTEAA